MQIVTGDTKVVERGKADGCYITTAGVGRAGPAVDARRAAAQPGDAVLVSGPIGDHGITIMLARGELDIEADLVSDTAPLHELAAALLDAVPRRRAARCATPPAAAWRPSSTRSRVASRSRSCVDEAAVPVRPEVAARASCSASTRCTWPARAAWSRSSPPTGRRRAGGAAVATRSAPAPPSSAGSATTRPAWCCSSTAFGGTRIVDLLVGDPLPRIC